MSLDKKTWVEAVSDSLPDVRAVACQSVTQSTFEPAGGVVIFRFIRFTAKTYFGLGPGLRHFALNLDNSMPGA